MLSDRLMVCQRRATQRKWWGIITWIACGYLWGSYTLKMTWVKYNGFQWQEKLWFHCNTDKWTKTKAQDRDQNRDQPGPTGARQSELEGRQIVQSGQIVMLCWCSLATRTSWVKLCLVIIPTIWKRWQTTKNQTQHKLCMLDWNITFLFYIIY